MINLSYKKLFDQILISKEFDLLNKFSDLPIEFQKLLTTEQDKDFHAEGNVLFHTEMVLKEALKLLTHNSEALMLSALFHDIGKSYTTKFDETIQRIIAPGHERLGGIETRYILHDYDFSPSQRRLISSLVSTHHLVKRIVLKWEANDISWKSLLFQTAIQTDLELLYNLELADMKGRICKDQERQIEIVELFKMLCLENELFDHLPKNFVNNENIDDLKFDFGFNKRYAIKEVYRRMMAGDIENEYQAKALCYNLSSHNPSKVKIMVGLPGSGKTTWINKFLSEEEKLYCKDEYIIISTDKIRYELYGSENVMDHGEAYQKSFELLKENLRKGKDIIWDATCCNRDTRQKLAGICHAYNAYVEMIVFDLPLSKIFEQNKKRDRFVPESVIERMAKKFEFPNPSEYHNIVYVS